MSTVRPDVLRIISLSHKAVVSHKAVGVLVRQVRREPTRCLIPRVVREDLRRLDVALEANNARAGAVGADNTLCLIEF